MAATTANVAWPIQANSPSIPSFRKSLVPKNDFNVYKSLITQDKGSYINRMGHAPSTENSKRADTIKQLKKTNKKHD